MVELNPKLLAFILGETEEAVAAAIGFLCAPDARSRTKEQEGRRLVREGEFAYLVVNGAKYRAMSDPQPRRAQNREAKRRERRIKAEAAGREARFVAADARGDEAAADAIAAEGLPSE